MKKYVKYLVAVVLTILVILVGKMSIETSYVNELNENVDVDGLQLLTTVESNAEQHSNYDEEGGWGGRFFHQMDGDYSIVYSGYPDVMDSYKLTDIHMKSVKHSVFDITIGSKADAVYTVMNSNGYKKDRHGPSFHGSSQTNYYFTKGKIGIAFYLKEDNTVESILIRLNSTNKMGVVF